MDRDCLIMAKEDFLEKLGHQIDLGKDLIESGSNEMIPLELHGWTKVVSSYVEDKEYESLRSKYTLWNDYNVELLKASFDKPDNDYLSSYKSAGSYISGFRQKSKTMILREGIGRKIENLQGIFNKIELIPSTPDIVSFMEKESKQNVLTNKVFIVHGHDSNTRNEAELLMKQLGLDPVVLFKKVNEGDTIIEKLLRESKDAAFAIVLYTKCDEGKAVEEADLKPRARQNVVFEHGLMCGLLGRKRVVALVEEGVEIPGDLSGVVYIPLDAAKRWQLDVAREMKASGMQVDLNKLM